MDSNEIIKIFNNECKNNSLSDGFISAENGVIRKNSPIVGQFSYGIVYLRDDAVNVLIERINQLENESRHLRDLNAELLYLLELRKNK